MNGHGKIYENRFLVWVMFALPILCTGWFSLIIWTIVQLCLLDKDIIEYEAYKEREAKKYKEHNVIKPSICIKREVRDYNFRLPKSLKEERERLTNELGGNWIVTKEGKWINLDDYSNVHYI